MLSTDKQTDKQTDKLINATKNITSFAKEVIKKYKENVKKYSQYIYTKILEVNLFAFAYRPFMKISLQSSQYVMWFFFPRNLPASWCIVTVMYLLMLWWATVSDVSAPADIPKMDRVSASSYSSDSSTSGMASFRNTMHLEFVFRYCCQDCPNCPSNVLKWAGQFGQPGQQ